MIRVCCRLSQRVHRICGSVSVYHRLCSSSANPTKPSPSPSSSPWIKVGAAVGSTAALALAWTRLNSTGDGDGDGNGPKTVGDTEPSVAHVDGNADGDGANVVEPFTLQRFEKQLLFWSVVKDQCERRLMNLLGTGVRYLPSHPPSPSPSPSPSQSPSPSPSPPPSPSPSLPSSPSLLPTSSPSPSPSPSPQMHRR